MIKRDDLKTDSGSWTAPARAPEVLRDAIALATFAVTSPDLRDVTRKEVLSRYVLVLLTHGTANGKYGTRYRSVGAIGVTDSVALEHEHVFTRKWLIEQMLDSPSMVETLLTHFAIACTVTSKEHRLLSSVGRTHPELIGWERYDAAGVEVVDLATGQVVPQSVGARPPLPHEQGVD